MNNKVNRDINNKRPIIIHYHYHYCPQQPTHPHYNHKVDYLTRIRSDGKIKLQKNKQQKTNTDSSASQSSWKKLVKPEFQSTITTTPSSSQQLYTTKASQTNKKPYSQTSIEEVSELKFQTPKNIQKKEKNYSSIIPINSNTSFRQNNFKEAINNAPRSLIENMDNMNMDQNPQMRKNRFIKKREIQIMNARSTEKQQIRSSQYTDYKYSLLQEQCIYLRQRFLSHYVNHHSIKKTSK